ncbi:hypothetical protein OB13_15435 [Pontibacter sp. HJ8]
MKYSLEKIPGWIRLLTALALLAALTALALTDNYNGILSGLLGGLFAGLLIGEFAVYLKKRRSKQQS